MKDYSYGVIPIFRKITGVDEPYFLLIEQYGEFWSFPKGHKEVGENDREAASREFVEETGIRVFDLVDSAKFIEHYFYHHEKEMIDKTVSFYPCFCAEYFPVLDYKEVTDAHWVTYEEAKKLLTFKETLAILEEAKKWLESDGKAIYAQTEINPVQIQRVSLKAAISVEDKYFLLQDQSGNWELPGGKLEFGEPIVGALKREVAEEIGIRDLEVGKPIGAFDFKVDPKDGLTIRQFIIIVFECSSKVSNIKLSHEHQDSGWFTKEEIKSLPMREDYKKILSS